MNSEHMFWHNLIAMIVALSIAAFVVYSRRDVFEVLQNFPTDPVDIGEPLIVKREIRWLRDDCPGEMINRTILIDSSKFQHIVEANPYRNKRDGLVLTHRDWTTPAMPYGPAVMRNTLTMYCSPFYNYWPIVQSMPDVHFMVVKK